ncbi:ComEC/Rec2 family competence protein [Xanthomonas maliensis]|uniref:ComEC/Rec2 family competence protein n=1 Tax=Xanthomonas maliensis TaxID=1321368 RepID=UPI0003A274F2|nr:hypothetical protein [Xanthomonas maliensis]KAB7771074.1 hypothetical protein CKY51_03670 [Xanthomonas maliensis]
MHSMQINRRRFLGGLGGTLAATATPLSALAQTASTPPPASVAADQVREPLRGWSPGMLDIHHIGTGRGNATLLVCPDGTTMMIDAGAIDGLDKYLIDPLPNASRRPGEWVGRYVRRHLAQAGRHELDDFVLTHFHRDHMGECLPDTPLAPGGAYALTGVTDVAHLVPIRRYLDRGYPDYAYPQPLNDPSQRNYRAFIQAERARGATVERFRAGAADQLELQRRPGAYPQFAVRNLVVNGELWTGEGERTRSLFPAGAVPTENQCSLALRLHYGAFTYYSGGDLSNTTNYYGDDPWRDVETPVAQLAGAVDVAVANHHAYADAMGPASVRALRPRAIVILTNDSAHPSVTPLENLLSERLYPGPRDIYATAMKPENIVANKRVAELTSLSGHVVVRVDPGGGHYRIVVVDNSDEADRVLAVHGPYPSGRSPAV